MKSLTSILPPPRKTTQNAPSEGSSLRSSLLFFYINKVKNLHANRSKAPQQLNLAQTNRVD